ncbi:hypothetical protein [Vibrio fluvialis]|uniref:hypothetical protein n=1 Tax=Vibrio fluvialis TaxID=676 RepID=UPI001558CF8D|nr:hypothetical protein [Vibrio fluvialis]
MNCKMHLSLLSILIAGSFPALAADDIQATGNSGTNTENATSVPTSSDNELPKGVLKFPFDLSSDDYCIPAKVSLRLIDQTNDSYIVYRPERGALGDWLYEPNLEDKSGKPKNNYCGDNKPILPASRKIKLAKKEVNLDYASKFGWQYGALIAPYKYYTSNGDLSGGATIAPYFGWRLNIEPINFSFTPILFAGPTMVNVEKSDGSDSNVFGVSVGTGLLLELHKEFNMGFVLGYDVVSKSEDFDNNGRPWLSVSFGYKFGG